MRKIKVWKKCSKVAAVLALTLTLSVGTVYASSIQEAQEDKKEAQENKDNAEAVLEDLEEAKKNLLNEVENLDKQIGSLETEVANLTTDAEELQKEIDETQLKLADAQVAEDDQYAAMMKRIQYLYENGEVEYIDTLMSSASFTDMLNKSEYIEQLSAYDQSQLNKLVETKKSIEDYEKTLEKDMVEIQSVKNDLEKQTDELTTVKADKKSTISEYEEDITKQEALVAVYQDELEAANKKIAEYERASINAQQNSGQTIYDASNYDGVFMWPTTTSTYITSYFGPRNSPTAGASSYHQGLDIAASYGEDIVAAESGTVIISTYSGGAGNYVMIDHGNGVSTVYMHNSSLCVNVGDSVVKGQTIAKAGSTGVSTGTHCHFGVRINGVYVNPLDYL